MAESYHDGNHWVVGGVQDVYGTTNFKAGATEAHANTPAFQAGIVEGAGAVAGAAGQVQRIVKAVTVVDNTATDLATVTVPNAIHGAGIRVFAMGALGDGDSADSAIWDIGVSRIAGAAAKAVASSKVGAGATAGATANAVLTISVTGMTGAVGASQTFKIQAKVARSAGAADNHPVVAVIEVLNALASGVTVA